MKNAILVLAIAVTAASTAQANTIDISLDQSTLSGSSGSVLHFFGTLTNTTGAVVWLNTAGYSGTLPDSNAFDATPFFNNTPLYLNPNASTGDVGLFDVSILGSFAVGSYNGTLTLLGGADGNSQDILGSVNFTVIVTAPASGGAPEPGALPLFGAGIGLLLAWKRFGPAARCRRAKHPNWEPRSTLRFAGTWRRFWRRVSSATPRAGGSSCGSWSRRRSPDGRVTSRNPRWQPGYST